MMKYSMHDPYRPVLEPARSIYDAFVAEAFKRDGRDFDGSLTAECDAVFREAVNQAEKRGLRLPSRDEIIQAEQDARGLVDYGTKWANGVADAMYKFE